MTHQLELNLQNLRSRSALALNNIAVHLLERRCYPQAVESLKQAHKLTFLTNTDNSSATEKISSDSQYEKDERGQDHVNRALQYLSHPKQADRAALILEVLTATQDGTVVQGELSSNESALESVLEDAPSSHLGFLVRLEDDFGVLSERQKAIISHNFGIACFCLGKALKKRSAAKQFLETSCRLAEEASHALLSYLGRMETSCKPENKDTVIQLHCLIVATLNSLIHSQQECSFKEQAHESYALLVHFRSEAWDLQHFKEPTSFFRASRNPRKHRTTSLSNQSAAAA